MEYSDIFIPVSESFYKGQTPFSPQQLGNRIKLGVTGFDWEWLRDFKIALIGLRPTGAPHSFTALRNALYQLYAPQKEIAIIDLGDIEIDNSNVEINIERVSYPLQQILSQGVFPLVFSDNMRYSHLVYSALKTQHRNFTASYILPHANLGDAKSPLSEQNFVAHTFCDLNRELSHLSILGYQNYLTNPDDLKLLEENYCETLRLGTIRDNIQLAEPLLRDATLLCASANAVRQSDAPAALYPTPNGFYAEEMCRLLRFAGFSDELKAFYMGSFNFGNDQYAQTANLVAQLTWHIIEGIANRVNEHPLNELKNYRRLQVEMGTQDKQLVFYQSKLTDRWWMEIPAADHDKKLIISCLKSDYEQASHFEISDRWLWFFNKFSSLN